METTIIATTITRKSNVALMLEITTKRAETRTIAAVTRTITTRRNNLHLYLQWIWISRWLHVCFIEFYDLFVIFLIVFNSILIFMKQTGTRPVKAPTQKKWNWISNWKLIAPQLPLLLQSLLKYDFFRVHGLFR